MARPFEGKYFICLHCSSSFRRCQGDIRRGRTKYCSQKCAWIVHRGSGNGAWKGGSFISRAGYKKIKIGSKYVPEHRYFMEQHLGRKLSSMEDVHHINHDKLDNRIENLQVLSKSEHTHTHGRRGEKNNKAKLKTEDIIYIREQNKFGVSQSRLAAKFGVDKTNISCIITRKTWKHIA